MALAPRTKQPQPLKVKGRRNGTAAVAPGDILEVVSRAIRNRPQRFLVQVTTVGRKRDGLCRVALFQGLLAQHVKPGEVRLGGRRVLFVATFLWRAQMRRGKARIVGTASVRISEHELALFEMWNTALLAKAVEIGWQPGMSYDLLFTP